MAPVDGRLPTAITHLSGWVSTSTPFQASGRRDFSGSRWCSLSSSAVVAGDEDDERRWFAKDPGTQM